jgi:iron complex outermembrane receptor protein
MRRLPADCASRVGPCGLCLEPRTPPGAASPVAIAVAGILASAGAHADVAGRAPDAEGTRVTLEEVVVTATRREERVVDVPYNISAISGASIEGQGIVSSADLLRGVPGVNVVDRGYRNSGVINAARIRGINADSAILGDYVAAGQSPVSTYVNDTPVYANFLLKDVERVEILRGPQGTLYGSGALGGTIKYILSPPSLGKLTAGLTTSASRNAGSEGIGWGGDGMLNLPVGATVAVRLNVSELRLSGTVDYPNIYRLDSSGIPVAPQGVLSPDAVFTSKKDADTVAITYGRAALLWRPAEIWAVTLSYIGQKDTIGGRRQTTPPGTPNFAIGGVYGDYAQGAVLLEPSHRDVGLTSLEASVDLGFATLTSSTSYTDHTGDSQNDNTGFYAHHFLGLYYYYPRPVAEKHRDYTDRSTIEELRLVSKGGGPWDYTTGLFYQREHINSSETDILRGFMSWFNAMRAADPTFAPFYPAGPLTSERDFLYSRDERFTSEAIFGELTYRLNEAHQVSVGARLFHDKADILTDVAPSLYVFSSETVSTLPAITRTRPLFKLNYSWHATHDSLIYATASQGYRRGGANAVPITGNLAERDTWETYRDDKVNNYEVGFKGFGRRWSYSLTAFMINWKNIQLNTATPTWGFYATTNVGDARSKGAELEFSGALTDELSFTLGASYTDAYLTTDGFKPSALGTVAPTVKIASPGERLPAVPKTVASGYLSYNRPLNANLRLLTNFGFTYQGSQLNALQGDRDGLGVTLDSYTLWNGSVGVDFGKWNLMLLGRNLFNSRGVSGLFTEAYSGSNAPNNFLGDTTRQLIATPRTVTLQASFRFE